MFERILNLMREKVRKKEYVMTLHAEEEMTNDDLSIYDVESGILTGRIIERQKDRETGERKYQISGMTFSHENVEVMTKTSPTGKLIIITVYRP